jgi:hypothetical protein
LHQPCYRQKTGAFETGSFWTRDKNGLTECKNKNLISLDIERAGKEKWFSQRSRIVWRLEYTQELVGKTQRDMAFSPFCLTCISMAGPFGSSCHLIPYTTQSFLLIFKIFVFFIIALFLFFSWNADPLEVGSRAGCTFKSIHDALLERVSKLDLGRNIGRQHGWAFRDFFFAFPTEILHTTRNGHAAPSCYITT